MRIATRAASAVSSVLPGPYRLPAPARDVHRRLRTSGFRREAVLSRPAPGAHDGRVAVGWQHPDDVTAVMSFLPSGAVSCHVGLVQLSSVGRLLLTWEGDSVSVFAAVCAAAGGGDLAYAEWEALAAVPGLPAELVAGRCDAPVPLRIAAALLG